MNQSPSPSTPPAASGVSASTMFYQKISQVYETVRVLLDDVKSMQTMVELSCPHLRSHRSNLDAMHAAQHENLEQRLHQADIIPVSRPPEHLSVFKYMCKVIFGDENNDITGGYVDFEQLKACTDELKRRMPEGIRYVDLTAHGIEISSDYFTSDAQAERAAPMIRERTDWRIADPAN